MGHSTSMNHAKRAKQGFLLGLGLFTVGAIGELIGHRLVTDMPGWEQALFFDMVIFGTLLGLLAPLIFGIVLPLIE